MAMAIPQRVPWYMAPLQLLRAIFQVRRFPGVPMAILVFLLVIPGLFAEWIARLREAGDDTSASNGA